MAEPSKEDLRREIAQILQGADLSALSSKKVRLKLQDTFDVDLAERKKEIDQILMRLIAESQAAAASSSKERDEQENEEGEEEAEKETAQASTGTSSGKRDAHRTDSSSDELKDSSPPAKRKKKKKKESSKPATKPKEKKEKAKKKETKSTKKREAPKSQANVEDSDEEATINDEELAWKLHQEETRRTRNHSARKAAPVKSKSTTKAASKKENGAAKDKAKTGYVADMILSPELASIIGADKMSRHEVVKRMWGIIKERNLMDPRNKQFHICDDELFKVFGRRRIRTFSMMKYLKGHIKDPRNLTTPV